MPGFGIKSFEKLYSADFEGILFYFSFVDSAFSNAEFGINITVPILF